MATITVDEALRDIERILAFAATFQLMLPDKALIALAAGEKLVVLIRETQGALNPLPVIDVSSLGKDHQAAMDALGGALGEEASA